MNKRSDCMKKLWMIFGIISVMFLLSACKDDNKVALETKKGKINYVDSEAKLLREYNTLKELEDDSEIILRAKKINGTPIITRDGDMVNEFRTISNLEIQKVFKNEKGYKLNPKEKIEVVETAAFDKETDTMYGSAGYVLMNDNESYLLFLRKSEVAENTYVIRGAFHGKVPLDTNLSEDIQYAGHQNHSKKENNGQKGKMEKMFKEAKDKYK